MIKAKRQPDLALPCTARVARGKYTRSPLHRAPPLSSCTGFPHHRIQTCAFSKSSFDSCLVSALLKPGDISRMSL